jgi:hypothetical protein
MAACALHQVGNLQRGDDLAQIIGHRRPKRDQADAPPLDLLAERSDPPIERKRLVRGLALEPAQCADRGRDRRLGPSAELGHGRPQLLQIVVERLDGMR